MTHEKRLALAREMNARLAAIRQAGQIATRDLIRKDGLTADEITGLVGLYPIWQPDTEYPVDDLIAHEGILYQVVQGHTSQSGWEPPNVPALFVSKTPAGVIPEWVQPSGAHDAYNVGDQVIFEGQIYVSVIDGNTWSPATYPQGWKAV